MLCYVAAYQRSCYDHPQMSTQCIAFCHSQKFDQIAIVRLLQNVVPSQTNHSGFWAQETFHNCIETNWYWFIVQRSTTGCKGCTNNTNMRISSVILFPASALGATGITKCQGKLLQRGRYINGGNLRFLKKNCSFISVAVRGGYYGSLLGCHKGSRSIGVGSNDLEWPLALPIYRLPQWWYSFKEFLDPHPDPDYQRTLIDLSLARAPPFHGILRKSLEWFLRNPTYKQTN